MATVHSAVSENLTIIFAELKGEPKRISIKVPIHNNKTYIYIYIYAWTKEHFNTTLCTSYCSFIASVT